MENKVITVTAPLLPSLDDFLPYLQDVLFPPENACNSEQSKEKQSKEKENTPPKHIFNSIKYSNNYRTNSYYFL